MKQFRLLLSTVICSILSFGLLAQSNLNDFVGTYKMGDNPYVKTVNVSVKEGKLMLGAEGFPDAVLTAGTTPDAFVLEQMSAGISFKRENGKVKGIEIDAQGNTIKGELQAAASGLSMYVGTYKMADNEYVKNLIISEKDGKLGLSNDATPTEVAVLAPGKEAGSFTTSIQGYDAEILFTADSGKVKSIKLSVAGGQVVLSGEKQ